MVEMLAQGASLSLAAAVAGFRAAQARGPLSRPPAPNAAI
jgi:hypothetical protein